MSEPPRGRGTLLSLALVVAVGVAFANSFAGVFVFDDVPDIVANPYLRTLWPPTKELWAAPGSGLTGRPVVAWTFAVNYALSGLDTWSYHAFNLAVHAGAALCLFGVVRRACELPRATPWMRERRDALAFGTALVWSVHPLHVGAVTLVVQRCESLMGLFFLAGLAAALERLKRPEARAPVFLAAACAALGAGTKESIAMLPLVVFALDWAFVSGSAGAALRVHRGLYLALATAFPLVALSVAFGGIHRASSAGVLDEVTWWAWITSQGPAIVEYLRLVLVPWPILVDYGWPIPRSPIEWLPHAGLVVALLAASAWAAVRAPRAGAVAASFFLMLAPASSFVPIPFELYAIHRMYLPLAALVALVVAGVLRAGARLPRAVPLAVLVAAAAACAWTTRLANAPFASAERLWRAALEHRPDNDRAWVNLGDALAARGEIEPARAAYQRAVDLHPTHALYYNNLARFDALLGHLDDAIAHWERAVALLPDATLERENLANALLLRGDAAGALAHFERLAELEAGSPAFLRGRGRALARLGRAPEALDALVRALAAAPDDPRSLECLVLLRATVSDPAVRDGAEALRLVDAARGDSRSGPAPPEGRLRAAALAELGRFDEAVGEVERALAALGPATAETLRAQLERERELYRGRQPLRDALP